MARLLGSPFCRNLAGGGDEVEQFPPSSADVNMWGLKHGKRLLQLIQGCQWFEILQNLGKGLCYLYAVCLASL